MSNKEEAGDRQKAVGSESTAGELVPPKSIRHEPVDDSTVRIGTAIEHGAAIETGRISPAPTKAKSKEPVHCYATRTFYHDGMRMAGDWLYLSPEWFAFHKKEGNVIDTASFLATQAGL